MYLSTESEGQIIQKYERLIKSIVKRFLKPSEYWQYCDDCFQECAIVLLKKIRSINSLDDLRFQFPFQDMRRAMQYYLLSTTSYRYPKASTGLRKRLAEDREKRVILPDGYEPGRGEDVGLDDVPFRVDFERFCESLSEMEQIIVKRKLDGVKNTVIAKELGVPDYKVTRMIQRIQRKYLAECL